MSVPDCNNAGCVRWMAEHDGRINAWWTQQREWNLKMEQKVDKHSLRLGALERKVLFISGAAAAIGSIVGALVSGFMQ